MEGAAGAWRLHFSPLENIGGNKEKIGNSHMGTPGCLVGSLRFPEVWWAQGRGKENEGVLSIYRVPRGNIINATVFEC